MIALTPSENATLAAAGRAAIRNFPPTATTKAELRAMSERIRVAMKSEAAPIRTAVTSERASA